MDIHVTSINTKSVTSKLKRATKTAIKSGMKQVELEYRRFILKRFRSGADWVPKKHPNGKPTLVNTGRLRNDVGHLKVSLVGNRLTASVITPYAKYHQFGTSKMPKREILVAPPKNVLKKMVKILQKSLTKYL